VFAAAAGPGAVAPVRAPPRRCPVTYMYLYVEDVDGIISAGEVAEDCPWGMREAGLTDPGGTRCESDPRSGIHNREPGLMRSKIAVPLACH
jgi:hypothetical protein